MRYMYLLLILLLAACISSDEETVGGANGTTDTPAVQNEADVAADYGNAFENANELQLFFKEDQSVATFVGEGNEFASFVETTEWLDEQTVQLTIDNGGAIIYKLYTISDDSISLVYEDVTPPTEAVNSYSIMEEFMSLPVEVGTSFGEWTITEMDMTIDTPLETFTGVIEVSNESANLISRRYYAHTFGLIMQVDQMQTADGLYEVRSTLETLIFK